MDLIDTYSELDSVDTDFEEQSARELVDLILENDVKMYRKFLPEIRKLDSNSFKNMFCGNKNYNYAIKNKHQFNQLLNKFENFKFLLEEWYEDATTYIYIKELWEKYISIESLRDKKEKEIEDFLSGKDIEYISWPQRIKKQFLKIIQNTKDTIIFAYKKSFKKIPDLMKNLLGKLYTISQYCCTHGKKMFSNLSKNQIFIILRKIYNIDLEKLAILSNTFIDLVSGYQDKVFELVLEAGGSLPIFTEDYFELIKGINGPLIGSILYSAFSFYSLYNSYDNYKTIKNQLKNVKEYEKKIDEIEKDFEKHKKKIKDLSENNELDLNAFNLELENCVKLILEDKEKISKLIMEIKTCIKQKIEQQKNAGFNALGSGIKMVAGIVGVVLTRGAPCAINALGAAANGASIILDSINISNLKDIIENLEKSLERAKQVESTINDELIKLQDKLKENEEASPVFC